MPSRDKVDRERVRQLLAKGLTQAQVCVRLGISRAVVSKVANEKPLPT